MSLFWRFLRAGGAVLGVTAVLVAGVACGTEPQPDDPQPPPTTAPASPPATEPEGDEEGEDEEEAEPTIVNLTMIDNRLLLDQTSFPAGTYTFVAEQQGQNPHALSISGPGVDETTPQVAAGGGSVEFTVTLEPGTYQMWCPVPGHRQDGMEVTIEVT